MTSWAVRDMMDGRADSGEEMVWKRGSKKQLVSVNW